MANFRRKTHHEHIIENDDGTIFGRIRIHPDRILWGDKETKKWRRVTLEEFQAFMNNGHDLVDD